MKLTQKQIRRFMMWGLGMLLLIRLVFFLPDNTSDFIESLLIWLIFILSIAFIVYIINQDYEKITVLLSKYRDKLFIFYLIFLLEIGLLIKNDLGFNQLYIFSIALMAFLVVIFSLILPKKVSKVFDITFILFYTIYVFGQDYYYRIFDDFFSFKEYGTIKEGLAFADGMYEFSFLHVYIILIGVSTLVFYILHKNTSHIKLSFSAIKGLVVFP